MSSTRLTIFGFGFALTSFLNVSSGKDFFKYSTTSKDSHQQSNIFQQGKPSSLFVLQYLNETGPPSLGHLR